MTNESLKGRLKSLKKSGVFDGLGIKRGIEKEFFRVDKKGFISKKPHPKSLGSALKNKYNLHKIHYAGNKLYKMKKL